MSNAICPIHGAPHIKAECGLCSLRRAHDELTETARADGDRAIAHETLAEFTTKYFDLSLRELLRHDLTTFASSSGIKPADIISRAMTYAQMAAGAMLGTQYPDLAEIIRREAQGDAPE